MSLNSAQAMTTTKLISPISTTLTATATSSWVDVRQAEGDLIFINEVGALTGSIAWTIEHASSATGAGATGITPNEGAYDAVTANNIQKRTVNAGAVSGWVRCVGTISTGPVLVAASLTHLPKYPGV